MVLTPKSAIAIITLQLRKNGSSLLGNASVLRGRHSRYQRPRARHRRLKGETMNAKLYLTISAVLLVLYAIGFILFPGPSVVLFGGPPEPHVMLNLPFFGATLLALGLT